MKQAEASAAGDGSDLGFAASSSFAATENSGMTANSGVRLPGNRYALRRSAARLF